MTRRLLLVPAALASITVAACATGLALGGDGTDESLTFSACYAGVQPTVKLWRNTKFGYADVSWGPAIFRMRVAGVTVPGATVGFLAAPLCPDDDVVAYRCRWHRENPRTDLDTGLPLPEGEEYAPDPECSSAGEAR